MTEAERARAYLARDPVLYANLRELLRREPGGLRYAGPDGVLMYDPVSGAHMMSALSPAAARTLFALLPEGCKLLTGHETDYFLDAADYLQLGEAQLCYSALYERGEPLPIPAGDFALAPLGREHAPYVLAHYSHAPGGLDFIQRAIDRGMVGAFVGGVLAGFVGVHEEGSIGLLEVLPGYRRRGLGEALEAAAVNLAVEQGRIPFGQIIAGNTASLTLQRKLGFSISNTRMFWLFG